ncbi:HEAT repeat domain-containing protein [Gracilibacillus caseinilyticus]|uniref:HEAT repeat domain-containing protein n=1 Tax=Gracilibacillus caseinilyticus TaxID=2932256 RepID=A0ABY4EYY4_9BACI|nr:HEAT repeat domain-containing protein [Gracilibacillus caseinilyticus]UOQ49122.1 HEAT repeat domain-containing protein [Gracilibacillus caseinilyticus]
MFINLQAAYWMIGSLFILMFILSTITLSIKVNKKRVEKKERQCLSELQSYIQYLQTQLDNAERLRTPAKKLRTFEKKVLQKRLVQLVDQLEGVHRQKLLTLCKDIGLISYNRERLKSPWSIVRIDAAFHLGILRDSGSTSTLFSMLFRNKIEPSIYIIARSIAQTSTSVTEMKTLLRYLVENGKQDSHLVADIAKEAEVDLGTVYADFLNESKVEFVKVGLIGLQNQVDFHIPENVDRFLDSDDREVRILAAKLLTISMSLNKKDIEVYMQFPDWEVRYHFVEWIGNSELKQFADLLKEGVEDSNWMVSRASAKSLIQLGTRGFEIICELAFGNDGDQGIEVAHEFMEEELKQSIHSFSNLADITDYNQKVYIYQKYFGKSDDYLIKSV